MRALRIIAMVAIVAAPGVAGESDLAEVKTRCGANCAYVAARLFGREVQLSEFRGTAGPEGLDMTALDLCNTIQSVGLQSAAQSITIAELAESKHVAIVLLQRLDVPDKGHWVVICPGKLGPVVVDPPHDPAPIQVLTDRVGASKYVAVLISDSKAPVRAATQMLPIALAFLLAFCSTLIAARPLSRLRVKVGE